MTARILMTLALCLAFTLSGCLTVRSDFVEESIDENGNPVTTKYNGLAIAPYGGKLEPSSHAMGMVVNPDGSYDLSVGQTSEGGSVEGAAATIAALQGFLDLLAATAVSP